NVPPVVSAEIAEPPVALVYLASTGMPELIATGLPESLKSVAETMFVPGTLEVSGNCQAPADSRAFAGKVAIASLEAILTRSVTLFIRFQLSSTALTVIVNCTSGAWANGVPDFPVTLPGANVSPGASTRSLVNGPALTTTG